MFKLRDFSLAKNIAKHKQLSLSNYGQIHDLVRYLFNYKIYGFKVNNKYIDVKNIYKF